MVGYLVYNDYLPTIQDAAFRQWIASNDATRIQTEPRAQATMKEYLVQKYDLSTEFQPTTLFSETATYQANALVQLNYAAWVVQNYLAGQYVSYIDGNVYRCILNTSSSQAPGNATYWLLIGAQLSLAYLAYPYPIFDDESVYSIGDRVFWKGSVYQCLIATIIPGHITTLQAGTYANVQPLNVFPDDKINGVTYWGTGIPYTVSGLYPNAILGAWSNVTAYTIGQRINYNGITYEALKASTNVIPGSDIITWQPETWIVGDNRNQSLVEVMVKLTLYSLSFRISPKMVPVWVQDRYNEALKWLQNSAEGIITLDVPILQPDQGNRIRFGGRVKNLNDY